jgi:hypothetical protein
VPAIAAHALCLPGGRNDHYQAMAQENPTMTRRQPSEPNKLQDATDWRRFSYRLWHAGMHGRSTIAMKTANHYESLEPIAHQPAGTVGITELLKTQ